ncbi:uncharacterized protein L969DRAFT_223533 [Mixia osmundae IAM 14324]|uniref:Delta 8-(E)-sphingolipid desaturase n=1 Tax=Mixia osmundae (strain CBS 9802 / IAM 14324 / JCM 22182 / KY 12970) TaxID=764103 RepID=G7DT00_MIXOS|nr:uncharacterized protein L969DRAFT_223533 [Mixia osmundae IAM 14324]KEI37224.1 hypothetical protein L969DRAFT_223533 [Mixia osmundae IAM 14324]GAA93710.1 hypothetical protein E5Q_00356 [Mixia osmundae IAM 14324]
MLTGELQTLSRDQIAFLIAQGHVLVLHRQLVYRLNAWLARHPGGPLAILHFVGRDACDEIEAYHPEPTLRRMRHFVVGKVDASEYTDELGWKPLVPPVQSLAWSGKADAYQSTPTFAASLAQYERRGAGDSTPVPPQLEPEAPRSSISPEREHKISLAYRALHDQVIAAGLYDPKPLKNYRWELLRYGALFASFVYFYTTATATWQYLLSAFSLGLFWHQVTFVVHDAGHMEITGSHRWDRLLGICIADFIGGLSVGWWCDNHDVHHIVTNDTQHDPDIQHMPFFAISPNFFKSMRSTYYDRIMEYDAPARFFVSIQHKLYFLVMMFGRFNLFALSYTFLATKAPRGFYRNLEMTGIAFFWIWFSLLLKGIPTTGLRIAFVMVAFATTSPLHVQIVLSHFAMSTEDVGLYESFASRQIRTTMDVECPAYLDFLHGGLHMQVTHHLFPRLPRHNLRAANALVRQFCKDQDLRYHIYTFSEGNSRVLGVLRDVANQVEVMTKVASAHAKGEIEH